MFPVKTLSNKVEGSKRTLFYESLHLQTNIGLWNEKKILKSRRQSLNQEFLSSKTVK